MHALVVDVARYVGPVGVRLDVAAHPAKTYFTAGLRSVRRPVVSSALGLSYERFVDEDDNLAVTLEAFAEKPAGANASITKALVSEQDRGAADSELFLVGRQRVGLAGAVMWMIPWLGMQAQVGGLGTFTSRDLIYSASVSKRWQDAPGSLRASAELLVFSGDADVTPIGAGAIYDANDALLFGVDGVF